MVRRPTPVRIKRKKRPPTVTTHADIVRLWPSVPEFAADIGVSVFAARKMVLRNSIADEHWSLIADAAAARGLRTKRRESVTVELLAEIRSASRRRRTENPSEATPKVA